MNIDLIKFIPWIPLLGAALCGVCCMKPSIRKLAGPISVLSIFIPFLIACGVYSASTAGGGGHVVEVYRWIGVGNFQINMAYLVDPLTMIMLFVVTGIGSLIATYAMGYMKGDRGYARFFMGVSLFIFAMTTLVMADNLVLLYLGWEGVGLCSYLLIGYYYDKPEAVAAAKKAFIVNRIGDLGFALGIFLTYKSYGSVSLSEVIEVARENIGKEGYVLSTADLWIPFLLMLGAFGKSAQIPLYVWLPDAMAGPTPVSALIHAATMVTAGVYMIARLIPVFQLSPYALPTVAVVGGVTAVLTGTIALCQYDLKKIFAYSTVSQIGYMFLGVGALSTFGGIFHLFTHAFFKALLFLTAGSVMHALAGQLDLRAMSGLRHKMPVTCWLMFIGCLALAGFPFTAGFFSKDTILAETLMRGVGEDGSWLFFWLAILGLFTAFLTAFYTFRLWFRVFMGPEQFEMGDEHGHAADGDDAHGDDHGHAHEPHEMPWWPMNAPLAVLAFGALFAGLIINWTGWMETGIEGSTADPVAVHTETHATVEPANRIITVENPAEGLDTHAATVDTAQGTDEAQGGDHGSHFIHNLMMVVSSLIALAGIGLAAYFHWLNRPLTDRIAQKYAAVVEVLYNKYYVDEFYDFTIVRPLRGLGKWFFVIDERVINGLVMVIGNMPKIVARPVQLSQHGKMQGYGLGMVLGVAIAALLVFMWAF
jgi:NADH-quinone oxidoreductase subunit L